MISRRLPFRRWPLHHHILLACLIVLGMAAGSFWWIQQSRSALLTLQHERQSVQGQLDAALRSGPPIVKPDFTQSLPTLARSDDVARDIGRFAQPLNVQITSLTVDPRAATPSELGRVLFNLTGQAAYKDTKAWLAELLSRYPSLAIQSLSLRTQPTDPVRQDVRVTLVLVVKD